MASSIPTSPRSSSPSPVPVIPGHFPLEVWALDILSTVQYHAADGGYHVELTCGHIPDRYARIDEVFKRIGGKWNGRKRRHLFPFDPEPIIKAIIQNGRMPEKNPLSFFPTPREVLRRMIDDSASRSDLDWIVENTHDRILEPSAGTGAIVCVLLELYPALKGRIDCIEPDPLKCNILTALGAGTVYNMRFEDWEPTPGAEYRAILMNPPFSIPGNELAYTDHIRKACRLLKDGINVFTAIAPSSFLEWRNESGKRGDFRNFIADNFTVERLDAGAFKESGTNVKTVIISGEMSKRPWRDTSTAGYADDHTFQVMAFLTNNAEHDDELLALGEALAANGIEHVADLSRHAEPQAHLNALISRASEELEHTAEILISTRPTTLHSIREEIIAHCRNRYQEVHGCFPAVATRPHPESVSVNSPTIQPELFPIG